jgi:general secretion pathway protein K
MVLWVIIILVVIAFSFSLLARSEAFSTLRFKQDVEGKFLAEAALERGIMEIFFRLTYKNQVQLEKEREIFKVDGRSYSGEMGKDRYTLRISDESGKININLMTDFSGIILNNLLVNLGVEKEKADVVVDSILDWKDDDNLHRLHGAEDEYYLALSKPYKAKNKPLETIEELLLVRGVTRELLYGAEGKPGLVSFITIYGSTDKININAAPKEILMAVPGMTPEAAERIIEARDSEEILAYSTILAVTGDNSLNVSRYLDITESNAYTIEGLGFPGERKRGYGIRATILLEGGSKVRFLYYRSPAEVRQ